jgi:hypothetical protein
MDYISLPEYKRLNEALQRLSAFQKLHQEEIQCPGCKLCLDARDFDDVLVYHREPSFAKRPCSHHKVVTEHLSSEHLQEFEGIHQEMSEANAAYLRAIGYGHLLKQR